MSAEGVRPGPQRIVAGAEHERDDLPHNDEAERMTLGGIFVDNATYASVVEVITRTDFYSEAHRHIFDAMAALAGRGEPTGARQ